MSSRVISVLGLGLAFLLIGLNGCSSSKEPLSSATWSQLENVVTSKKFRFEARWAVPIGGRVSRIDIAGDNAYMKMQGDNLVMELPYFGQRQVAQMGGGNQGIRFEGTTTDISTGRNEKKNYYNLDFSTRNQSELLQCNLQVFSGMSAVLTVNSNQRNAIRYEGRLMPLE